MMVIIIITIIMNIEITLRRDWDNVLSFRVVFQGVFVVLAGGLTVGLLVWCGEQLLSIAKNTASL